MNRRIRAALLFVLLMGFWLLLSWRLDPLLLSLGFASSVLVTWLAVPVFEAALGDARQTPRVNLPRLLWYLLWLVSRIPAAAVVVARVVLDHRLPPRPGVVRFRTSLGNPTARSLLATSITIVPGTITVDVDGDDFVVHAFTPDAVLDLATADMQNRIVKVFGLRPEQPPTMTWDPVHDELPEDPQ